MPQNTTRIVEAHYAAYEAYAEFCSAAMAAIMDKRTWSQLNRPETKADVCSLAHDYALEMMRHRADEMHALEHEVD